MGPNEDRQYSIVKGKIDGDKITIEADHEGHTIKLALVGGVSRHGRAAAAAR